MNLHPVHNLCPAISEAAFLHKAGCIMPDGRISILLVHTLFLFPVLNLWCAEENIPAPCAQPVPCNSGVAFLHKALCNRPCDALLQTL